MELGDLVVFGVLCIYVLVMLVLTGVGPREEDEVSTPQQELVDQ